MNTVTIIGNNNRVSDFIEKELSLHISGDENRVTIYVLDSASREEKVSRILELAGNTRHI